MPLLEARALSRSLGEDKPVFSGISFAVEAGDILFIRGPSGAGKTLLLRSVALLDPLEGGSLRLRGQSPAELGGIPFWRADVCYVHQARVDFPGTPTEFFEAVRGLCARRGRACGDLPPLVAALGLEPSVVLHQAWASLSGGQAQRISLAVAVALRPAVLLLDEPTSALDADAARRAEALLTGCGAALLWVTHDDGQPGRVGRGRRLELPSGAVAPVGGGDGDAQGAAAAAAAAAAAGGGRGAPPAVEVAIGP